VLSKPAPTRISEKTAAASPEQRLRLGLEATAERVVQLEHTIQVLNPNLPAVFSTPSMIGLMEHATVLAIASEFATRCYFGGHAN